MKTKIAEGEIVRLAITAAKKRSCRHHRVFVDAMGREVRLQHGTILHFVEGLELRVARPWGEGSEALPAQYHCVKVVMAGRTRALMLPPGTEDGNCADTPFVKVGARTYDLSHFPVNQVAKVIALPA